MNQWKRTRDLRIFALESRLGELEKRVDSMENGKRQHAVEAAGPHDLLARPEPNRPHSRS